MAEGGRQVAEGYFPAFFWCSAPRHFPPGERGSWALAVEMGAGGSPKVPEFRMTLLPPDRSLPSDAPRRRRCWNKFF